jgi:hypothetical protein
MAAIADPKNVPRLIFGRAPIFFAAPGLVLQARQHGGPGSSTPVLEMRGRKLGAQVT